MSKTLEEEIINERAEQLEKIGFKFKNDENHCWYQKGEVRMIPTLMMCASEKEWQEFIKLHSEPEAQASVATKDDSSTSDDQQNNSSNSGEQQPVTGGKLKGSLSVETMKSLHTVISLDGGIKEEDKLTYLFATIQAIHKDLLSQASEAGNVVTGDDLNWYHIGWNEKSRHIREYGSLICSNCYPPNNINFKTTKEEFEKLKQFWLENVEPGQQDWDELIEKEEDYYLKSGKYEIRFLNRADLLRELSSKYLLIKKDK